MEIQKTTTDKTAVKISKSLYDQIADIAKTDGRKITWLIDKAVFNYLKSKKRG